MNLNNNLFLNKDFLTRPEYAKVRDGFGEQLVIEGEANKNIVVLTADLKESTRVHKFAEKFKDRFFDVGVAEQNLAGLSAGLGLSGKIAVMTSYATFSPGRNWDQIRVSICYSKSNVKIVSGDVGVATAHDGATHMGLEDIAITRVLPNMVVLSPLDYEQTKKALSSALKIEGPVYMRICREDTIKLTSDKTPFDIGKAQIITHGDSITIIGTGPILHDALVAANEYELSTNQSVEVINVHTIKPIDVETIVKSAKKTGKVLTIEDHQITGGLGSAVSEVLSQNCPVKMKIMGIKDTFGESGYYGELKNKYGIDSRAILQNLHELNKTID